MALPTVVPWPLGLGRCPCVFTSHMVASVLVYTVTLTLLHGKVRSCPFESGQSCETNRETNRMWGGGVTLGEQQREDRVQ